MSDFFLNRSKLILILFFLGHRLEKAEKSVFREKTDAIDVGQRSEAKHL